MPHSDMQTMQIAGHNTSKATIHAQSSTNEAKADLRVLYRVSAGSCTIVGEAADAAMGLPSVKAITGHP